MWIIETLMDNFDPRKLMFLGAMFLDGDDDGGGDGGTPDPVIPSQPVNWKSHLDPDIMGSPLVQKFAEDPSGLNEAFKSHLGLEKLLGSEKVPIPKGMDDKEGWAKFSKAMGVPDNAEAYGLSDPELPEEMKGEFNFDKAQFSEVAKSLHLSPNQAKELWKAYTSTAVQERTNQIAELKANMTNAINTLRGKWGDAYEGNIQLGQMVINKFANGNKEMEDYLTSALSQDARGIEFLAKVGSQFAENKIGEFSATRYTNSPEQASEEIEKLTKDLDGAYHNASGKFTHSEHEAMVARVNRLHAIVRKGQG